MTGHVVATANGPGMAPDSAHAPVYRRILRRETHSARSTLAIALAVVLILGLACVATEAVLSVLSLPPLSITPGGMLASAVRLPDLVSTPGLVAAGSVAAAAGALLVGVAVSPGRTPDRVGETTRTAAVFDDRAIASALAGRAARAAGVDPDHVTVTLGRRSAEVRIQPSSGWSVDRDAVDEAVVAEIRRLNVAPVLSHRIVIVRKGAVGA